MLEKFHRDYDLKEDSSYKFTICPVCGCLTLNGYYICDICGWEYDGTVMERERSIFNSNLSVKSYRKKFLSGCSPKIQEAYKKLVCTTKNKYWVFNPSFIANRIRQYSEFYNQDFIDDLTKEYIHKICWMKKIR